jgi:eukaryotic-like serine/threonine-protein kinase
MIGRTIQNYHVEELLGEGGMGTVYRATDTLLRRPVAIKMLHPHLLRDSTFMERFRNEAVLSAQLNHPNVATLYNLLQDRTDNLMVMELVDGMTVERLLTKQGKLPVEVTVRIIIQALDGLQHAHNKGILHRDIKPANLMLTKEGTVKLMDFGIARLVGSQRLTRADRVVGTLEYMAPELLSGVEPSVQSDLYAIGVLMYELLSGKMPFEPTTENTLINQILNKKPIPLRSRLNDLPRPIEDVLDKLLQKKPEKRYEKASDLRQALAVIVTPAPINPQIFEPKKSTVPPTRLADVKTEKPQVGPTRLASSTSDKPTRQAQLMENLMSMEGMILLGAFVIALGIIGFWMFDSNRTSQKEEAKVIAKDTIQLSKQPVAAVKTDTISLPRQAVVNVQPPKSNVPNPVEPRPIPQQPKLKTPVTKKQPVEEKPNDKAPTSPKEEPIVKEEPIHKNEPASPKHNITVELRGEAFSIEFSQTVSSDASEGQTVWLRTVSSVSIDGITVIPKGAKVRAKVTEARSASNTQKALLAIRFEAVEAVNGQWIPIKFPEYSDKSTDQVVFQQGRRVNNLRTTRTTLTVQL